MSQAKIDKSIKAAYSEVNGLVALMYEEAYSLNDFLENTEDILINAFNKGAEDALTMLGRQVDTLDEFNLVGSLHSALEQPIANQTYRNRLILGFYSYSKAEMQRLVANEWHRMYNMGSYELAKAISVQEHKTIMKTWHTLKDEKVRESHFYLDGIRVELDEKFYTMGDETLLPGMFSNPENNINCRCTVKYEEI